MTLAYYNERDPFAAQWLRNLIAAGLIAPGHVDDRSIEDVKAADVRGYRQCHWFAGIAGWSLALRLAGWPDDRECWTGSCPCQPFSAAGKGKAADDERHLWPCWFSLIRECKPPIVFGEQVEAAVGWGWLDLVFSDLETEGYACGAAVLPACSVGAPHIRQRLWFVAQRGAAGRIAAVKWREYDRPQAHELAYAQSEHGRLPEQPERLEDPELTGSGEARRMAHPSEPGRHELPLGPAGTHGRPAAQSGRLRDAGLLAHSMHAGRPEGRPVTGSGQTAGGGIAGELGDAECGGREGRQSEWRGANPALSPSSESPWSDLRWLPCTDGKARPTQPGLFPLAHGIPGRVGKLRAAGNAIVPPLAAEFIKAVMN